MWVWFLSSSHPVDLTFQILPASLEPLSRQDLSSIFSPRSWLWNSSNDARARPWLSRALRPSRAALTPHPADGLHASRPTHLPAVLGPEKHRMAGSMTTARTTQRPISGSEGKARSLLPPERGHHPHLLPLDPDSITHPLLGTLPSPHPGTVTASSMGICVLIPGMAEDLTTARLGNGSLPGRQGRAQQSGQRHCHAPVNNFNTSVLSVFICKAPRMFLFRHLGCKSSFRDSCYHLTCILIRHN